MVRVLEVDNYPITEGFERPRKSLTENGAEVTSSNWAGTGASRFNEFDGFTLSGTPDMMSEENTQRKLMTEVDAIGDAQVQLLGVGFGHQLMAHAFGSRAMGDKGKALKFAKTSPRVHNPSFMGSPRDMMLLESHHEAVRRLSADFQLLARNETSLVAAMRNERRPLYGTQFDPERYTPADLAENRVIGNSVKLLR